LNGYNIIQEANVELEMDFNTNNRVIEKMEYHKKLSIERINFKFEEYEMFPEVNFRPGIFFFKFLCVKPDLRKECILYIFKFYLCFLL